MSKKVTYYRCLKCNKPFVLLTDATIHEDKCKGKSKERFTEIEFE